MNKSLLGFALLLFLAFGCSKQFPEGKVNDRFTVSKEGLIIDNKMNLEWLPDSGKSMTRTQAFKYAKDIVSAGHHDWRLPTIAELGSLHDESQGLVWKIHPVFRLGGGIVWTSEPSGGQIIYVFGFYPFEEYWPHRALIGRLRVLVVRSRE